MVYESIIESKWFESSKETPFESAFYSNFEDAIFNLSNKIATQ